MALLWSPRMSRPSHQVPPRPLFIANPGIRGVARLRSPFAATLTGAVCAPASIGQSPALTSRPKSAVTSPNVAAVLQVPRGRSLGLKLLVVEPFSGCLPWAVIRAGFSRLVSVTVLQILGSLI